MRNCPGIEARIGVVVGPKNDGQSIFLPADGGALSTDRRSKIVSAGQPYKWGGQGGGPTEIVGGHLEPTGNGPHGNVTAMACVAVGGVLGVGGTCMIGDGILLGTHCINMASHVFN